MAEHEDDKTSASGSKSASASGGDSDEEQESLGSGDSSDDGDPGNTFEHDLTTKKGKRVGSVKITRAAGGKAFAMQFDGAFTVDMKALLGRAFEVPLSADGKSEIYYVSPPAKDTIDFADARGDYDKLAALTLEDWAREHGYVGFSAFMPGKKAADGERGKRIADIKVQFAAAPDLVLKVARTHYNHTIIHSHDLSIIKKLLKEAKVVSKADAKLMSAMGKKCQRAFYDSVAALVEKGEAVKCPFEECKRGPINVASGDWELDMGYPRAHIADVLKTLQECGCLWVVSGKRLLELAYDPTHFKPSHSNCNTGAVATRQRNYEILARIVKPSADCVADKAKREHVEAVLKETEAKYAASKELDRTLEAGTTKVEAKCLIITEFANAVVAALEDAGLE